MDPQYEILLSERKGQRPERHVAATRGSKLVYVKHDVNLNTFRFENLTSGVKNFLHSVFLPDGYPSSVSKDYTQYQIWDTIQAFSSSLTGALSTKAVLESIGVGDSTSTSLGATLSWLIKDGTGMVGRILFAWLKGTELDADCKKWRLFADILNDGAICLELCAPYIGLIFHESKVITTTFLSVAGVAKSIVGVAGGATRAALTQHQARHGNLADVSAKDGSQETLVNLVALMTSLWLLPLVGDSQRLTWLTFLAFTFLHIFANYKAVKSVTMNTLNRTRTLLLFRNYYHCGAYELMSVDHINFSEPVVIGFIPKDKDICGYDIKLACSVEEICQAVSSECLQKFLHLFRDLKRKYAIIPDEVNRTMYVILAEHFDAKQLFRVYYEALTTAAVAAKKMHSTTRLDYDANPIYDDRDILEIMKDHVKPTFSDGFLSTLKFLGWDTKKLHFTLPDWRVKWD